MTPHLQLITFKQVIFPHVGLIDMDGKRANMKTTCARLNVPFFLMPERINLIAHEALGLLLYDETDKRKPTSGFCAIMHYMENINNAKIYIAGFDGYTSGHHYYAPGPTPRNVHRKHLPGREKDIIDQWIKEKKIFQLEAMPLPQ